MSLICGVNPQCWAATWRCFHSFCFTYSFSPQVWKNHRRYNDTVIQHSDFNITKILLYHDSWGSPPTTPMPFYLFLFFFYFFYWINLRSDSDVVFFYGRQILFLAVGHGCECQTWGKGLVVWFWDAPQHLDITHKKSLPLCFLASLLWHVPRCAANQSTDTSKLYITMIA